MNVACGSALRGGSFMGGSTLVPTAEKALRLRDKFAPKRPSSRDSGWGVVAPTIGEKERGVGAGEKEEICKSITKS